MENFTYWISWRRRNYVHHNCEVSSLMKIRGVDYNVILQNGHIGNEYPSNKFSFCLVYADSYHAAGVIKDFWNYCEADIEKMDYYDLERYKLKDLGDAMNFMIEVQDKIQEKIDEADEHISSMIKYGDLKEIENLLLDNNFEYDVLSGFYGQENDPEAIIEFLETEAKKKGCGQSNRV